MREYFHESPYLESPYQVFDDEQYQVFEVLFTIVNHLHRLEQAQGSIMADLTTLSNDVTTLAQSVAGGKTALDDLAAKVANLSVGNVSQADIDALDASVKAASASLQASVTADDPSATAPADAPPVAPTAPVTAPDPTPTPVADPAPVDPAPVAPVSDPTPADPASPVATPDAPVTPPDSAPTVPAAS